MNVRFTILLMLAGSLLLPGCAHLGLRRNSIKQADSIADIQEQQVIDNLAKFVYDINSMPSFAYPNQGTNQITNSASGAVTPGLSTPTSGPKAGSLVFSSLGLSFSGLHQSQEAFTLIPVNNPRKLELMRCAYQQAVTGCCGGSPSDSCPDCQARLNLFYTGDPQGNIREKTNGSVSSECLEKKCWFHVCCKKCLPRSCECLRVGQYCGVYVWVGSDGRDELTKLTLCILDYALNDPPVRVSKEIVYYIDEHGLPTTLKESVGKVTANIAISDRPERVLNIPTKEESELEQLLRSQIDYVDQQLALDETQKNATLLEDLLLQRRQLAGKLEYLKMRANSQDLSSEFVPRDQTLLGPTAPGATSPNILQFNQLLNQVR